MPGAVLVTGAAGFLGSHLAVELARSGSRVYALARGRDGRSATGGSATARFDALRPYFTEDLPPSRRNGLWPPPGLTVIEGDVEEPWLGLGRRAARRLFDDLDQVVHCAARVDFRESRREAVISANAGALRHLLPLASPGGPVINLVSTAYVCGLPEGSSARDPFAETPVSLDRTFRNPYEESKALAERFVMHRLGARGVPWRVLRPSIVIGAATTGRTRSFNALYVLLELLDSLRPDPLDSSAGAAAEPERLRIRCDPGSALNLVPVDWLTAAMRTLLQPRGTLGGIFHLTQPRPMTHRELGEVLSRIFAPLRIEPLSAEDFEREPAGRREALLARGLRIYEDYLDRHPRFDDRRARRVLDAAGLACPPVHELWLRRLVGYARVVEWGRARPSPPLAPPLPTHPSSLSPLEKGGAGGELGGEGDAGCDLLDFFDHHLLTFRGRPLLSGTRRMDAVFEVRLTDVPGFRRTVEIRDGELRRVVSGETRDPALNGASGPRPECRYEMSGKVLRRILSAELDPREAFFARETEIHGDMEAGLRVASLMVDFFRRHPYGPAGAAAEPRDEACLTGAHGHR